MSTAGIFITKQLPTTIIALWYRPYNECEWKWEGAARVNRKFQSFIMITLEFDKFYSLANMNDPETIFSDSW